MVVCKSLQEFLAEIKIGPDDLRRFDENITRADEKFPFGSLLLVDCQRTVLLSAAQNKNLPDKDRSDRFNPVIRLYRTSMLWQDAAQYQIELC